MPRYSLLNTLGLLKEDKDSATNQIELANKLIQLLASEIKNQGIEENLLLSEGKILKAVFSKINSPFNALIMHSRIGNKFW